MCNNGIYQSNNTDRIFVDSSIQFEYKYSDISEFLIVVMAMLMCYNRTYAHIEYNKFEKLNADNNV